MIFQLQYFSTHRTVISSIILEMNMSRTVLTQSLRYKHVQCKFIADAFKCKFSDWFQAQSSCFSFVGFLFNGHTFWTTNSTLMFHDFSVIASHVSNPGSPVREIRFKMRKCRLVIYKLKLQHVDFLCFCVEMRTISVHFHFYKQYFYMSDSVCDLSAGWL